MWVDDVLSCTAGETNQEETLKIVNEFALRHKLKWGQSKCRVMRIGTHTKQASKREWLLGKMPIDETTTYRYLGDEISNDGKNTINLNSRRIKTQTTTTSINTIASTEVLRMIETPVLLNLHEAITIPGLLANAESWNLSKTETNELERIEIQSLKNLFDLPIHQPTPSIIFSFGILYSKQRIEQKRLIYLHRILKRTDSHWTKKVLLALDEKNLGWCKSIKETLRNLSLPTQYHEIRAFTIRQWERIVKQKIINSNLNRLKEECYKKVNGKKEIKSKTSHILHHIENSNYTTQPCPELLSCTKQETKTLMIARFRMLECGNNFKGTMATLCNICKVKDDENHRLNDCKKFRLTNSYDTDEKANFEKIFSNDVGELRAIIKKIESVWDTRNAHGTMIN